ncbi:unnamed protein product [Thelazia callipaeda]|uniref:IlGF domain-containing protein n=1 Tax=Thelazia callipaeda TaxID=103827 RepID=A0A0N5D3J6_THECL|nr:unnamed protein product [Thelazia callipaeda]
MRLAHPTYSLCFLILCLGSTSEEQHFGSLVLCPPGGHSFATAYMMACEMKKRRRRKREFGYSAMRPATLKEIQKICCDVGCEIRDLLDYCDPFGGFNN